MTYEKRPSDLRKMPIRPTKNAHLTFEKFPSDLQKMLIRPTKSAHLTYKIDRRPTAAINYFYPTALYA